jgi:hypothetical protein
MNSQSGRDASPGRAGSHVLAALAVLVLAGCDAPYTSTPSNGSAVTVESTTEPAGIGDGTHIVGVDIQPGTYRSAGATPSFIELCMWSTKSGASSNSNIIDIGSANADEQQVVEIGRGVKAFESNGCEPWEKIG